MGAAKLPSALTESGCRIHGVHCRVAIVMGKFGAGAANVKRTVSGSSACTSCMAGPILPL
ncbi:hypothetical protein D3C86_1793170 [compost metagenome]